MYTGLLSAKTWMLTANSAPQKQKIWNLAPWIKITTRPEHAEIRHKNSSKEQYKVLESKAHGFRGHKNVTNAIFWLDLHWHQVQRIAAGGASVCCQRTVTCSITCLQSRRMAHTVRSKQETWSLIHAPSHARLYLRQRLARTDGTKVRLHQILWLQFLNIYLNWINLRTKTQVSYLKAPSKVRTTDLRWMQYWSIIKSSLHKVINYKRYLRNVTKLTE
jgi:hypothetical protein